MALALWPLVQYFCSLFPTRSVPSTFFFIGIEISLKLLSVSDEMANKTRFMCKQAFGHFRDQILIRWKNCTGDRMAKCENLIEASKREQEKSFRALVCCWSNTVAGHTFPLFQALDNLRLGKQVYHPEDAFWSLDKLPGVLGSLQGSAQDQGKKIHYSLLSCFYWCMKNVKYLYENPGRLATERILFEDFWGEFWGRDWNIIWIKMSTT